ncbi:class III lanthionine synthetase LanKC [Streptosporangium sp. V21-05]|uniref:class III lanthionine synthetase LanKC n=1 Tax=Streptosporangium sp. V21-05 TaxID=3446115 RepID=UPI003F53E3C9
MQDMMQIYTLADPLFFEEPTRWSGGVGFIGDAGLAVSREAVPEGWVRKERGVWVSLRPAGQATAEQGWKVHLSATLDNADRLCSAAWDYCVGRGIPFKHLRDRNMLLVFNAKYSPRGSSGKLVTIYPRDEEELRAVLTDLSAELEGEPGPYILSDLRWGAGPLFVRYGGFIEMTCVDEHGETVFAIRHPDGTLLPDRRRPVFDPPKWVELPEFLRPHLDSRRDGAGAELPYLVRRALHFSNAGGVYLATRRTDGREVVLKEARPHTAVDANHQDAITRMARESWALTALRGIPGIPELYDELDVAGHRFLVEEYMDGQPLNVWCGTAHPWVTRAEPTEEEIASYTRRAVRVADRIEALIGAVHERGVVFGDLHLGNVIVRPDESVALVDFELAFDATDADWRPGLSATGFGSRNKSGTDRDLHALAAVRLAMFLPYSKITALQPDKVHGFVRMMCDGFPVPQDWAGTILSHLAPGSSVSTASPAGTRRPDEDPVGLDEPVVDWGAVRASLAKGILGSATPEREDRLFPGDVHQFLSGGLGFAHGAAGVLWALDVTGHGRHPEHERWLIDAVGRTVPRRPGFYDGTAGLVYVLDHLGYRDEAAELLDRHPVPDRANISMFSGFAGIGAALAHLSGERGLAPGGRDHLAGERDRAPGGRDHLTAALAIADRLADAVRRGDPGTARGPGLPAPTRPVEPGLMRGWCGVALFLIRMFERTGDPGHLDHAALAVGLDLDRCVTTADGGLVAEEAGVRTMPYLDVGSAGIALVADEFLAHREDDRLRTSLPGLLRACRTRVALQSDLFRGTAGQVAVLSRLADGSADGSANGSADAPGNDTGENAHPGGSPGSPPDGSRSGPEGEALDRRLRDLCRHAVSFRGHLAFPGTNGFRLSMDLATGGAGVLLAMSQAAGTGTPFLPFFSSRGER